VGTPVWHEVEAVDAGEGGIAAIMEDGRKAAAPGEWMPTPPPNRAGICAVIVSYNPDERLVDLVEAVRPQVGGLVLVDNASSDPALGMVRTFENQELEIIRNERNLGVAAALNQGLAYARRNGFEWGLTLDQDSLPADDMVAHLCQAFEAAGGGDAIAILAPQLVDPRLGRRTPFLRSAAGLFFRRTRCTGDILTGVTTAVTAGALMRINIVDALGGFREDFFIDYVDTEFCLRARSRGFRIVAACKAIMEHQLGQRDRRRVGPFVLYPTHHAVERWYYFGRNRVPMLRMYALRFPHWCLYELVAGTYGLLRMMAVEGRRIQKLGAFMRGTVDGLRGKMGGYV
jgi:rhamnosyltransferase